jgi:hypothetical protein
MKRRVITLCGAIRFEEWFKICAAELTLKGWIVLGPNVWGLHSLMHDSSKIDWATVKASLDNIHFDKIDLSVAIFVVDVMGYIGESTLKEIAYARGKRRHVFYWSKGDLTRL